MIASATPPLDIIVLSYFNTIYFLVNFVFTYTGELLITALNSSGVHLGRMNNKLVFGG